MLQTFLGRPFLKHFSTLQEIEEKSVEEINKVQLLMNGLFKRVLNPDFEELFYNDILTTFGIVEIAEYLKVKLDAPNKMDSLFRAI